MKQVRGTKGWKHSNLLGTKVLGRANERKIQSNGEKKKV